MTVQLLGQAHSALGIFSNASSDLPAIRRKPTWIANRWQSFRLAMTSRRVAESNEKK